MLYTSINNQKIKEINQLKQKKYRNKQNLFLIEGEHLLKEAYNSGFLKEMLILENIDFKLDVKTSYINEKIVYYLTEVEKPSGIFGVCEIPNSHIKDGRILILDGIQDPGNMGTIIRSAVAFNVDTIIVNYKCTDPYGSKVIRATQGMIFSSNIVKADIVETIKKLKKTHKIYVTKVDGGNDLKSVTKYEKSVIIIGSEGNGVSEEVRHLADEFLYIPMNEKCESLNVGVATSIILYEFGGE